MLILNITIYSQKNNNYHNYTIVTQSTLVMIKIKCFMRIKNATHVTTGSATIYLRNDVCYVTVPLSTSEN